MTEERDMTAPMTSVGAEVGQSPNITTDIISDYWGEFQPLSRGNVRGANAVRTGNAGTGSGGA